MKTHILLQKEKKICDDIWPMCDIIIAWEFNRLNACFDFLTWQGTENTHKSQGITGGWAFLVYANTVFS